MTLAEKWLAKLNGPEGARLDSGVSMGPDISTKLARTEKERIDRLFSELQQAVEKWASTEGREAKNAERHMTNLLQNLQAHCYRTEFARHTLKSTVDQLKDLRKQEDWADAWEKVRLLIFRIATTIAVAGIVLTTYWLAQRWGINMPMMPLPIR